MNEALSQGLDGTVNGVSIGFLIDAHILPAILLVIQFQYGAVGCGDHVIRRALREASQLSIRVFAEKGYILKFEPYCLLCGRPFGFVGIFPNS